MHFSELDSATGGEFSRNLAEEETRRAHALSQSKSSSFFPLIAGQDKLVRLYGGQRDRRNLAPVSSYAIAEASSAAGPGRQV